MNLAGDEIDRYLRVVRTMMDSLELSLDESILRAGVPSEFVAMVRTRWSQESALSTAPARVLSATRGGKRPWFQNWDPSQGYYWRRLRAYLVDNLARPLSMVDSLDDSTDRILANLEAPGPEGPAEFRVQGLVVGYIQSGKTANYSALITKAADAGYKLVIVLSGIHNELRRQTQLRLNRELGIGQEGKEAVGEPQAGRQWIAITGTGLHEDFRPGTVNSAILQGNDQVLAVVKKNGPVLRRLISWMQGRVPSNIPVLIIDDEADQASINTGGNRSDISQTLDAEDRDTSAPGNETAPSVINGQIRGLLTAFKRISFVAYTATPFANCLIPHDAEDSEVFSDLYPKDFIISLPKPPTYFGAERLFGRPAMSGEDEGILPLDVIRLVPESHRVMVSPESRAQAESFRPTMPPSLKKALLDFILGLAARSYRGDADKPSSMLVHIHYRTIVQDRLKDMLEYELKFLRNRWRYGKGVPELEQRWKTDFQPTIQQGEPSQAIPFVELRHHIDQVFKDPIRVLLLNSGSSDQLDYEAEPDLKAVIIGGNRLSRGLTLEGLLVSYFLRDTLYYDTLMQMGRWFGFRGDYVELTRLWTTADLVSNFRDLALAEEELRYEVTRYEREQLTPLDFGPRIRTHPVMLVTARNKMGAAHLLQQSYAGRLLQTVNFRLSDRAWLEDNLNFTREFFRELGTPGEIDPSKVTWSNISFEKIIDFLERYRAVPSARFDLDTVRRYILKQARRGELVKWVVSLRSRQDGSLGTEELGVSVRVNLIGRSRLRNTIGNIGSLINPATVGERGGDEETGLTDAQVAKAAQAARTNHLEYGEALRAQRSPQEGLLLLYPISRNSQPTKGGRREALFEDSEEGCTVIGVAFSFPASTSAEAVEYVANLAGAEE